MAHQAGKTQMELGIKLKSRFQPSSVEDVFNFLVPPAGSFPIRYTDLCHGHDKVSQAPSPSPSRIWTL
jgi:hypothetical protein